MNLKKCIKFIITFSAAIILSLALEVPLMAEFIFLKDGSITEGVIISDSAGSVTFRTADKKVKQIPRHSILRILYTKLKMGKIYIQKRDGKGLVAFMVDEDQENYTFRKELFKPEEFIIKRSDVLFVSEKNPSGLQVDGDISTDRVSLLWLPPYDAVKKYNIYIKNSEKDKYKLIDSTGSKSITLKHLSSNTTYFIIVTSIDNTDYESSPSNELKITTRNIRPSRPVISSIDIINANDNRIMWEPSDDPDGKVEKYRVYAILDKKRTMITELKKTEYTLKDVQRYSRVEIVAVDDKGDESYTSNVKFERNTIFGIYPGVIIPLGKFSDIAGIGYGGLIKFSERNILFKRFEVGIGAGFYYMDGKDLIEKGKSLYNRFLIIPLLVNTGYRFTFGDSFSIAPSLSLGASFININYMSKKLTTMGDLAEINETGNTIDPTAKAGLGIEYRITDSISFSLQGEYGLFVEKGGSMPFATATLSTDYRF